MATVTTTHTFSCADAAEVMTINDYLTANLADPTAWAITTDSGALTVTATITAAANL